jgi:hypothetical protein
MKNELPEIEIIFTSATHHDAEKCYDFLHEHGKIGENFKIIPRFWISGKGENQTDVRDDMLMIVYCDSRADFDKIRAELQHFQKIRHRYLFSNREEARTWVNEVPDSGLRVFIGLRDDTILGFRDVLRTAIPGVSEGMKLFK